MHGQRDAAVRTLEGVAALPAEHRRRVTAAIEQDEHLLAAAQSVVNCAGEIAADDDVGSLVGIFLAHVDDAHGGERTIEDTPLEHDACVLSRQGVLVGFH